MEIEWNIAATIAAPVLALFVGALINHALEDRPKVVSYLGHISSIRVIRNDQPLDVNTHSVVIRNTGRKTAKNVRLGHLSLPDFDVHPDIEYRVGELPRGGKEILFETLIPKKQVTITYLYFPPFTWEQVNTHIESDDGPAKVINVLPTQQFPRWFVVILWLLIAWGAVTLLYTLYYVVEWTVT